MSVAVGVATLPAGDEVGLVAAVLVVIVAVCPVDPLAGVVGLARQLFTDFRYGATPRKTGH